MHDINVEIFLENLKSFFGRKNQESNSTVLKNWGDEH